MALSTRACKTLVNRYIENSSEASLQQHTTICLIIEGFFLFFSQECQKDSFHAAGQKGQHNSGRCNSRVLNNSIDFYQFPFPWTPFVNAPLGSRRRTSTKGGNGRAKQHHHKGQLSTNWAPLSGGTTASHLRITPEPKTQGLTQVPCQTSQALAQQKVPSIWATMLFCETPSRVLHQTICDPIAVVRVCLCSPLCGRILFPLSGLLRADAPGVHRATVHCSNVKTRTLWRIYTHTLQGDNDRNEEDKNRNYLPSVQK